MTSEHNGHCSSSALMIVDSYRNDLEKQIDSLLAQDEELECVVVLNGADRTANTVLAEIQSRQPRFKFITLDGQEMHEALNRGLELCAGEYIFRICPGDTFYPRKTQLQRAFMQMNPQVVCCGSSVEHVPAGSIYVVIYPEYHHQFILYMLGHGRYYDGALCYRKSAIEEAGGYQVSGYVHDYDLCIRLAMVGEIANLPESLVRTVLLPYTERRHIELAIKTNIGNRLITFFQNHSDEQLEHWLGLDNPRGEEQAATLDWRSPLLERRACRGIKRLCVHRGDHWFEKLRHRVSRKAWKRYLCQNYENLAIRERGRIKCSSLLLKAFVMKPSFEFLEKSIYALIAGGGPPSFGRILSFRKCDEDELDGWQTDQNVQTKQKELWDSWPTKTRKDRWFWRPVHALNSFLFARFYSGFPVTRISTFKRHLKPGRAALVASGPSATSGKWGEAIDGCDLVCRTNNFMTSGLEEFVGARTDLWATMYAVPLTQPHDYLARQVDNIMLCRPMFDRYILAPTIKRRMFFSVQDLFVTKVRYLKGKKMMLFPSKEYLECCRRLNGAPPTTGVSAVYLLLLLGYRDLLIVGIDFFSHKDKSYYYGGHLNRPWQHAIDLEVNFVADEIKRSGAMLTCPDPLYSLMLEHGLAGQVKKLEPSE